LNTTAKCHSVRARMLAYSKSEGEMHALMSGLRDVPATVRVTAHVYSSEPISRLQQKMLLGLYQALKCAGDGYPLCSDEEQIIIDAMVGLMRRIAGNNGHCLDCCYTRERLSSEYYLHHVIPACHTPALWLRDIYEIAAN